MSAYTQNPSGHPPGSGQVISIANAHNLDGDGMLGLTQQIETALALGREQIRKLREDIAGLQTRSQQQLAEADRRMQEAKLKESQLQQALAAHQQATLRRERIVQAEAQTQKDRGDSLQRDLDNALQQLERARAESTQKIEAALQRASRSETELTQARATYQQLQAHFAESQGRAKQLHEALIRARTDITQKDAELAKLRAAHQQLQAQCAEAQGRGHQAQEALSQSQKELALYKDSWAQVLQRDRDARAFVGKKDEYEKRIRSLEARNEDLLQEAKTRVRGLEASKTQLETERAQLTQQLDQARKGLDAALGTAQQARAQANSVAASKDVIITDIAEDFARISSNRQVAESERDQLKSLLTSARQEIDGLKQNSDRMRRDYPLKDLLAHKESELARAVRELKTLKTGAPDRADVEALVETLVLQRDQLRELVRGSGMA